MFLLLEYRNTLLPPGIPAVRIFFISPIAGKGNPASREL
jgi:hypothetical protein